MRRLSGFLVAGAIMSLAFSQSAFAQQAPQKTTFNGAVALWAFNVPADQAANYEQVIAKLKEALSKSEAPEAKQQLTGWKVIKNAQAQPDGSLVYVHVIDVVPEADYSITNIVYSVFKDPAEQKQLYDQYRGAFVGNLGISSGTVAVDLSK